KRRCNADQDRVEPAVVVAFELDHFAAELATKSINCRSKRGSHTESAGSDHWSASPSLELRHGSFQAELRSIRMCRLGATQRGGVDQHHADPGAARRSTRRAPVKLRRSGSVPCWERGLVHACKS